MGHFAGRFDIQLTMKAIYESDPNKHMDIICSGNKIYQLTIKGGHEYKQIKFLDSYNFFPMALDKVGDALSLPNEVREKGKGYFPHAYNRIENYNTIRACLPPEQDYYVDSMLPAKYNKFHKWYVANKHKSFDLTKELREYGRNDVDLLLHALVKYRQLVRQITQTPYEDVYAHCTTLAGSTLRDIRMNHLEDETIAIIPRRGYIRRETQSRIALKFLKWYAAKHKKDVQHRDNRNERWITLPSGKKARVDGFIEEDNTVIEVQGCYWHGCPKHHWKRDKPLPDAKTPEELYADSQKRIEQIQAVGYKVCVYWECEIKEMLRKDHEMKEFFERCHDTNFIHFDDAFFGGRTNTHSLYANAENGKIFYADIQSLYPYCLFYSEFPVGIPEHRNFDKKVSWNKPNDVTEKGIYKVCITPPRNLFLPVLPVRIKETLMFPLCFKCAHENVSTRWCRHIDCKHDDHERQFVSTCTHIELKKALEKGYKVTHVYDAYVWSKWSTTLFRDYIKKNLKVKIESSGIPANFSEADKKKYRKEIQERYGFDLDVANWVLNEGLRTIAKLRLNSSWGKFGQRDDLSKTAICRSQYEVDEIFNMDGIKIKDCRLVTENTMFIRYKFLDEFVSESNFSNVVVALYTTSSARLRLYEFMEECERNGGNVLYTDTDSIICQAAKLPITIGNFLGDMVLEKPNHDILEFISGGAKQYGLRLRHKESGEESYELKLRGITLDKTTDSLINFHQFKRLVQENTEVRQQITTSYNRIQPSLYGGVRSIIQEKRYQPVINKGVFSDTPDDTRIYPYGYSFSSINRQPFVVK
jgi:hypothetical protein